MNMLFQEQANAIAKQLEDTQEPPTQGQHKEEDAQEQPTQAQNQEGDAQEQPTHGQHKEEDAQEQPTQAQHQVDDAQELPTQGQHKEEDAQEQPTQAQHQVEDAQELPTHGQHKEEDAQEQPSQAQHQVDDAQKQPIQAELQADDGSEQLTQAQPHEDDAQAQPTQLQLLERIEAGFRNGNIASYCDENGKIIVAFKNSEGKQTIYDAKSMAFEQYLYVDHYKETELMPKDSEVKKAKQIIAIRAHLSQKVTMHNRIALYVDPITQERAIYYDPADDTGQAVKITKSGVKIVDDPPVKFKHCRNIAKQVWLPQIAQRSESAIAWTERLKKFLNLSGDGYQTLFIIWLVSCLIPGYPHPIAILHGEQGSGKSIACSVARRLIDPAKRELLAMPNTPAALGASLVNNYMAPIDNVDVIQPWQSNILCRSVTNGEIFRTNIREYDEEVVVSANHCVILNGITQVATMPDLLDRSIIFGMNRITSAERKDEQTFWREFEADLPYILDGMFETLARAMKIHDEVHLDALPRMADFCKWGYAIAEALDAGGGDKFLEFYLKNIDTANDEAIFNNPVASSVYALMSDRHQWGEDTMTELFKALDNVAGITGINKAKLPKAANSLSRALKRVQTNLEAVGISFSFGTSSDPATMNCRTITIINANVKEAAEDENGADNEAEE